MKITLDLDKPQRIVDVMRAAALVELDLVAEQIEEQLPKPTPPEPKGDYLVREPSGQVSAPYPGGALNRQTDGARLYWDTLCAYHGADLKVYRLMPSPEALAVLVEESAARLMLDCPRTQGQADKFLTEFARQLLGGDQ